MGSKSSRSTGTCTFPGCGVPDGWGKGVGNVNIDVGDGFSYRLNHMRAAANGEDEQCLVLARPRPNIGHVYLPISSSFTSLPQPTNPLPSASPANRQRRPPQAASRLDDSPPTTQDQGRYHYHNKSPRPSHFRPSRLITKTRPPESEVVSHSREGKTRCERPEEYSSTSNINSLSKGTWPCSRRHPILN